MSVVPMALAGFGIPMITSWLTGQFPTSSRELAGPKGRNVMIGSMVGIAIAGLALAASQIPPPPVTPTTVGYPSMSVSDVTARIGTGTGLGIRYPGQMTGGVSTNGDLVYVD